MTPFNLYENFYANSDKRQRRQQQHAAAQDDGGNDIQTFHSFRPREIHLFFVSFDDTRPTVADIKLLRARAPALTKKTRTKVEANGICLCIIKTENSDGCANTTRATSTTQTMSFRIHYEASSHHNVAIVNIPIRFLRAQFAKLEFSRLRHREWNVSISKEAYVRFFRRRSAF